MDELSKITERYDRRKKTEIETKYSIYSSFRHFSRSEREFWFSKILTDHFPTSPDITVLDVGAGTGDHVGFFRRFGVPVQQIWASELLPDRVEVLKSWLPMEQIIPGNAQEIRPSLQVDVVFQSTVFSSILDLEFRKQLARKLWTLIKPGGMFLWYDFVVNSPNNSDVRGIPWKEVRELFPEAEKTFKVKTTLLPPLGRKVGRLYNFLNFPFLRTHIVVGLYKS